MVPGLGLTMMVNYFPKEIRKLLHTYAIIHHIGKVRHKKCQSLCDYQGP